MIATIRRLLSSLLGSRMNKGSGMTSLDADKVRFAILVHVGEWMQSQKLEDMTQIEDEYILRQLAKFNLFSLQDVIREVDRLAERLNLQSPFKT
jgi:hypothetical protein